METNVKVTEAKIIAAITMLGAIIATTAAATWYIRNDRLEQLREELNTLKSAKDWRLPDTMRSLNELSEKVRLDVAERKELDALRAELSQSTAKTAKLESDLKAALARSDELAATLQKNLAPSTNFDLSEGQAKELVKNGLAVGLSSVYGESVRLNLGEQTFGINIGQTKQFGYAGQQCGLSLIATNTRLSPNKASFSFYCTTDQKR
jgi:seryl-tRNA synthetase